MTTSRLSMSSLSLRDSEDIFQVRGDREAMRFWDWPADPDVTVTKAVTQQMLDEASSGEAHHWTARLGKDTSFVGLCDLSDVQEGESAELGFMVVRSSWGLGFGREIVIFLLEQATLLGLRSLSARIHGENDRSHNLLIRAGFEQAERLEDYEIRPGVFRDCRILKRQLE